ncbi:MAG: ribosome recycling factor [Verrucomicrobiota bacterium]
MSQRAPIGSRGISIDPDRSPNYTALAELTPLFAARATHDALTSWRTTALYMPLPVCYTRPMALDDILLESEEKMTKTEEVVLHEFAGVRTGKASPGLVENIQVEVYGSHMRIRELAGITTPEPRLILIQPWDAATVHPIEKAIQKSNLGLNPAVDKKFIRIVLPELSQERRVEFTRVARKMAEDGRVAIRHVRRDAIEHLKKESNKGGISEEDLEHAEKEVQKLTDQYIAKIDQHLSHKEKEIMTV